MQISAAVCVISLRGSSLVTKLDSSVTRYAMKYFRVLLKLQIVSLDGWPGWWVLIQLPQVVFVLNLLFGFVRFQITHRGKARYGGW